MKSWVEVMLVGIGLLSLFSCAGNSSTERSDGGGTADPCARYDTCSTCTSRNILPLHECGWCGNRCSSGTASGPATGSCGSNPWAWTEGACHGLRDNCCSTCAGTMGDECWSGLVCRNGAHPPLWDNEYAFACSLPTCNIYDGTCRTNSDCCGQLVCLGNVCRP